MRLPPPRAPEAAAPRTRARLAIAILPLLMLVTAGAGPVPGSGARGTAHPGLWPASRSQGLVDPAGEAFVSDLLARMSIEEKVGQMIQADISSVRPEDLREVPLGAILAGGNSPPLGAGAREGAARGTAADWVATARAFRAVALEARPGHLPIPILFGVDAVHGNSHVAGATVFPHNIGLGASHDPQLIGRIGEATAQETAATGFDWAFGPTLAVPQDPRWGRHYEGYSSDPALVRAYAPEMVRGLQGELAQGRLVQKGHVAASAKHFLADGGTHDGTDQGDALIGEGELIRVHAPGYEAAIDAGVLTIMASFSSWQGVKMTGNRSLLTDVLKGRLGFEGFVVSDWNSHGQLPGCANDSCPAAINAGIDMLMAPDGWRALYRNTLAQVRDGRISMARIDDAVRRILRVKARLGLFESERPWEGRPGVLASAEHRALAREAVRKSLVLIKNEGAVLPLLATAHVLVAGPGMDDIGRQCGGWTLSWQGTGNRNADFPQGESILSGLRAAIEAGGGTVEASAEGAFAKRPDAAVVVFGENPYAEGWGDLRTLEFEAGDKRALGLLRKLRAQGIPVVSVFLSGRPLWVNPEINASDAFVAAWLPGTEGGGIADVLVTDGAGRARADFAGTLPFAWPARALPSTTPLFARGYGLRYQEGGGTAGARAARLSEDSGVRGAGQNFANYLVQGRAMAPWSAELRSGRRTVHLGASAGAIDGILSSRAIDADGVQEGGRELEWTGAGEGSVAISGPPLDMRMLSNGEAALQLEYRVDAAPSAQVLVGIGCGPQCGATLDLSSMLRVAPYGAWKSLKMKLSCFRDAGADVSKVREPFVLRTSGTMRLALTNVRLTSDPAGAVCPPPGR